jgi:rod shape-determining protein MreD
MRAIFYFLLTLVLVFWLQMFGNYFGGATGFSANAVLVVVIYFGLSRGPLAGELLGFTWGLMVDASTLGLLGLHAVLFAGAGFLSGMLRRQLDEDKAWTQTIFTLAVSFLYVFLYFILDRIFAIGAHPMSWSMLAEPLINALIAPLLFWLMQRWSLAWDMAREEA